MKVKVFTAATMQDAIGQVKATLGRDAVILNTRRYKKGGLLGLFGTEMVEVLAAVDDRQVDNVNSKSYEQPEFKPLQVAAVKQKTPVDQVFPEIPNGYRSNLGEIKVPVQQVSMETDTKDKAFSDIKTEITSMKKLMETIVQSLPVSEAEIFLAPFVQELINKDIDPAVVEEMVRYLQENKLSPDTHKTIIYQLLANKIRQYLEQPEGIEVSIRGCTKVALIGPTGVGKTTTIAKLAAHFTLKQGYKVAVVTADTYRIAAVQQLKTYADIIGIPLEVVYSPDDLHKAFERHKDKNLILLDTAGRSPKNNEQIEELKDLLALDTDMEIHLVLSSTTRTRDALDIVQNFSPCSPQKYIFTKLDEASSLGTILNVMAKHPRKISYITTGQNVPDDIELANPQQIASLILRD